MLAEAAMTPRLPPLCTRESCMLSICVCGSMNLSIAAEQNRRLSSPRLKATESGSDAALIARATAPEVVPAKGALAIRGDVPHYRRGPYQTQHISRARVLLETIYEVTIGESLTMQHPGPRIASISFTPSLS